MALQGLQGFAAQHICGIMARLFDGSEEYMVVLLRLLLRVGITAILVYWILRAINRRK